MKVLGYNGGLDGYPAIFGSSHDSSATLVIDGEIVACCEEERFTRNKHTGEFPRSAIQWVLEQGGIKSVDELDLVTYYYSYPLMFNPGKLDQNRHAMNVLERGGMWVALRAMSAYNKFANYTDDRNRRVFERAFGTALPEDKFYVVPHHLCHTSSTFYHSPYSSALCLTLDAEGESASSVVVQAQGTDLNILHETFAPNSLGYLYTFVTTFLGFERHDEYKVMGLAPYGDPTKYRDYFRSIVRALPEGRFEVDPGLVTTLIARDGVFRGSGGMYPRRMTAALGPARRPGEPATQRHMDIAASLQEALEEVVLHVLTHWQRETGERNLCLAGGVALNCSMNGKIARSGLFDGIWIHPAAHDAGTSVGAALYGYHNVLHQPRRQEPAKRSIYLGPGYQKNDVEKALEEYGHKVKHSRPGDLYAHVAQAIADGKVVGWYQDRMEWGPRALGNRSILADARRDDMKDVVNHAVKMREGFRPFAPACLAEKAGEWFDMTGLTESPYMLFVVPVKNERRGQIPAVTHVDGSARVQTVTAEQNAKFHALLTAFDKITGVPVLLNTSFNVKGEPIVNTPQDAIRCFLNTKIDLLVLDDVVLEKRPEVAAALDRERAQSARDTGRVVDGQISL